MSYSSRQRDAILAVLREAGRPLVPQRILGAAQVQEPSLGIATVYRALKHFIEQGVVGQVEIPGAPPHYEVVDEKHHHHHFLCERCREVFELEGCVAQVCSLAPKGFSVERHEIVLYGQCAACRTAKRKNVVRPGK